VIAGVPLATVRHVFITHHHSDHNADYGTLLLLAWASGLRTRVDTWGPPPVEKPLGRQPRPRCAPSTGAEGLLGDSASLGALRPSARPRADDRTLLDYAERKRHARPLW
jgi:ribonuclease BN (tRNA processing enzyme)